MEGFVGLGRGIVCFLIVCSVHSQNTESPSCEESCTLTYPKHTFEEGHLEDSCLRGCRLYTLACRHSVNPPMEQCRQGCNESYNGTDMASSRSSCQQGCQFMKPLEDGRIQNLNRDLGMMQYYQAQARFHMLVHSIMGRFMEPMMEPEMDTDPEHSLNSHITWYFINVRPEEETQQRMGPHRVHMAPQHLWLNEPPRLPDPHTEQQVPLNAGPEYYEEGNGCQWVIRKVGVPKLLLLASLLLMLLALMWVCCSTANSRRRRRQQRKYKEEAEKAFIKYPHDLNYLDTGKCFAPEGLTLQAFPLPEKSAKL